MERGGRSQHSCTSGCTPASLCSGKGYTGTQRTSGKSSDQENHSHHGETCERQDSRRGSGGDRPRLQILFRDARRHYQGTTPGTRLSGKRKQEICQKGHHINARHTQTHQLRTRKRPVQGQRSDDDVRSHSI